MYMFVICDVLQFGEKKNHIVIKLHVAFFYHTFCDKSDSTIHKLKKNK